METKQIPSNQQLCFVFNASIDRTWRGSNIKYANQKGVVNAENRLRELQYKAPEVDEKI